jgi:hypothetical protein
MSKAADTTAELMTFNEVVREAAKRPYRLFSRRNGDGDSYCIDDAGLLHVETSDDIILSARDILAADWIFND